MLSVSSPVICTMAAQAAALILGTMYKGPMTNIVRAANTVPNSGEIRFVISRNVPLPLTRAR